EPARLHRALRVSLIAVDEGDLGRKRQLRLLRARQREQVLIVLSGDEVVRVKRGEAAELAAVGELDDARRLVGVEEIGELEWLERGPRRHDAVDDVAVEKAVQPRDRE